MFGGIESFIKIANTINAQDDSLTVPCLTDGHPKKGSYTYSR
jgi:hypothetical protein